MGEQFGDKYEILRELGRGGFGVVYLARDLSLDVTRALKVLHPTLLADPTFVERFRREAKTAARLEHPHIVTVYEFGEVEGKFYITMRYMRGGSLKEHLEEEKRLSWEDTLRVISQVAAGLAYAHEQDVVHRDLKPGNILFDGHGQAGVADFGFAKALSGDASASLTMSGGMVGTPAYMAPELWRGEAVGPWTDAYALACLVYEMLTGEVLFGGATPPVIMMAHFSPVNLDIDWPEDVPAGLAAVLHKALAQDPKERFEKVETFAEALQSLDKQHHWRPAHVMDELDSVEKDDIAVLPGGLEAILQQEVQAAIETEDWTSAVEAARTLMTLNAEAGRGALLAVAEGRSRWLVNGLQKLVQEAAGWNEVAQVLTEIQTWRREAGETKVPEVLLQGLMQAVEAQVKESRWEQAEGGLTLLRKMDAERWRIAAMRYWEARGAAATKQRDWEAAREAAAQVVALREKGALISPEPETPQRIVEESPETEVPAPSSNETDDRRVIPLPEQVTHFRRASIVLEPGLAVLKPWERAMGRPKAVVALTVLSDAQLLVGVVGSGVYQWNMRAARLKKTWLQVAVRDMAVSPDGKQIAVAVSHGGAVAFYRLGAEEPLRWKSEQVGALSVALSPDGRWVAGAFGGGAVALWEAESGRLVQRWDVRQAYQTSPVSVAFSPGSHLLAVALQDGGVVLCPWSEEDAAPLVLGKHQESALAVTFSPDGRWLASAGGTAVYLWNVARRTLEAELVYPAEAVCIAFSPNGQWLAAGLNARSVNVYMREVGGERGYYLEGHKSWVSAVAFSPNGQWLATGAYDGTVRIWDMTLLNAKA